MAKARHEAEKNMRADFPKENCMGKVSMIGELATHILEALQTASELVLALICFQMEMFTGAIFLMINSMAKEK